MNPGRMLEVFEAKHGDYYELLGQYPSRDERKNRRLRRLMRRHSDLVHMLTGYNMALRAGMRVRS